MKLINQTCTSTQLFMHTMWNTILNRVKVKKTWISTLVHVVYSKVPIIKATHLKKIIFYVLTMFKEIRSNKECARRVQCISYLCLSTYVWHSAKRFLKNVYTEAEKLHSLNEILKKDDFRRIIHTSKLHVFQSYLNWPNYLQRCDK